MVDIQCRTVGNHVTAKETGLDVECSLEKGLVCKASNNKNLCPDFEIRVLCQCGKLKLVELSPIKKYENGSSKTKLEINKKIITYLPHIICLKKYICKKM